MNSHTAVKVLLRSAHLHSDAETLEHLSHSQTQNVQANNLLLRSGADQLEFGRVLLLLLGWHHVVVHGCEPGVVDLDLVIAVALTGFGLGETHGANFGVGEDHRGDILVGKLGVANFVRAKETVAELATGGNSDWFGISWGTR